MRCDRCGENKSVSTYDVDGFTGRLCDDCIEVWDEIQSE